MPKSGRRPLGHNPSPQSWGLYPCPSFHTLPHPQVGLLGMVWTPARSSSRHNLISNGPWSQRGVHTCSHRRNWMEEVPAGLGASVWACWTENPVVLDTLELSLEMRIRILQADRNLGPRGLLTCLVWKKVIGGTLKPLLRSSLAWFSEWHCWKV